MKPAVDDLPQIGAIAQVHGPVVDIVCAALPPLHQVLLSRLNHETYIFEVHQHLDESHVRAITLHRTAGLRRGMAVFDSASSLHVPVGWSSEEPRPCHLTDDPGPIGSSKVKETCTPLNGTLVAPFTGSEETSDGGVTSGAGRVMAHTSALFGDSLPAASYAETV